MKRKKSYKVFDSTDQKNKQDINWRKKRIKMKQIIITDLIVQKLK